MISNPTEVPLIPRNVTFPVAKFLPSDIKEEYDELVKGYKGRAREVLDIFSNQEGVLGGSNYFAPILLRKVLPKGTRLATMADLGLAIENQPCFTVGFDNNVGIVIRTEGDNYERNDRLAKGLASQLKKRGLSLNSPKVIWFDELELKRDKDSAYGLAYNLTEEDSEILDAPELMHSDSRKFSRFDERGLPVFDGSTGKNLYTRQFGLSGLCLDKNNFLYSNIGDLDISYPFNRVVVVSGEATSPEK